MDDESNTMRKFLGWVILLALVGATGVLIYEASQSAQPTAEEIRAAIGDAMPGPETGDPPEMTDKIEIRGWKVWIGNYPKYSPIKVNPIERRRDPQDLERDIRTFRHAESRGAKVRDLWLTITGQNP